MLTFAQYLEESSRSFPLYHGIKNNLYAWNVLNTMEIQPKSAHVGKRLLLHDIGGIWYEGISTTRDINFAKKWSLFYATSFGIVLELNHKAIDDRYKIVPVNYFSIMTDKARVSDPFGKKDVTSTGEWKNEYEEFIVTKKPIPLNDRYLVAIHVNRTRYDKFKEYDDTSEELAKLLEGKYKHKVKFY